MIGYTALKWSSLHSIQLDPLLYALRSGAFGGSRRRCLERCFVHVDGFRSGHWILRRAAELTLTVPSRSTTTQNADTERTKDQFERCSSAKMPCSERQLMLVRT